NVFTGLKGLLSAIVTAIDAADDAGTDRDNGYMNGRTLDQLSSMDNSVYNKIKIEIDALPLTLPPSSAMAGVYARTDSTRGVWKAPANTSLSYVIKPTLQISHEEQGGLNVHTTGKSINAIRTFTGKGTLVWGARTLAGNDNEWRYINVRRFFNMVEESVGKATEQFVFEGNDANTWVRVRAMIENFLVLQWKAGALAGAKAEQAFYVRVGLGQTMTAQDILEGRMIIEIGMAAVRPAEFIILRFSHKMQEA
ncbi:MAG: phage tail sheath family protein, partial [Crocinitomicaceae bacterium]